jgi:hypothetical protein
LAFLPSKPEANQAPTVGIYRVNSWRRRISAHTPTDVGLTTCSPCPENSWHLHLDRFGLTETHRSLRWSRVIKVVIMAAVGWLVGEIATEELEAIGVPKHTATVVGGVNGGLI